MAALGLPPLTVIRPGEAVLAQWDFVQQLHHEGYDRMFTRVALTPQRLLGTSIMAGPTTERELGSVLGQHGRARRAQEKIQSMTGAWQVTLDAELATSPRPHVVGPTTLAAFRKPVYALAVQGSGMVVIENSPLSAEMLGRVVSQWESSQPLPP